MVNAKSPVIESNSPQWINVLRKAVLFGVLFALGICVGASKADALSITSPANNTSLSGSVPLMASIGAYGTTGPPVYYVDSVRGSDSNNGTSPASAWQTLTKVKNFISNTTLQPGTQILFARGDTWSGGLTLPTGINGTSANPIIFSNYGSGALPIIDGGSSANACFYARATGSGSTSLWSYITIDGFECRNTTRYGVLFYQNRGGSAGMPGIVVKNMNIHNTGPGAYGCGNSCSPNDSGEYLNQLMFLDENQMADGVKFLNNTVSTCGGHNCIQVHGDTGSPLLQGNTAYGCVHNCIDVKVSRGAMVKNNIAHGPAYGSPAGFYFENKSLRQINNSSITWENNVVYGLPNGIECEGNPSYTAVACKAYNNTVYNVGSGIVSASTAGVSWDVRNNILDTGDPIWVCKTNNSNSCGDITTWDYNDDGGTHGNVNTVLVGAHDLVGVDPKYINASAGNFALQSGSPCINKGQSGLTSTSDIGAY